MDFINSLVKLRKANKLTQQDVANVLNIARSTYNDIEHKRIKLSAEDLIKLCRFYNVSPNSITNYQDNVNIILSNEDILHLKSIKHIIDKIDKQVSNAYLINNYPTDNNEII